MKMGGYVVEKLIDNLLEVLGSSVLREVHGSTERSSVWVGQEAHDVVDCCVPLLLCYLCLHLSLFSALYSLKAEESPSPVTGEQSFRRPLLLGHHSPPLLFGCAVLSPTGRGQEWRWPVE